MTSIYFYVQSFKKKINKKKYDFNDDQKFLNVYTILWSAMLNNEYIYKETYNCYNMFMKTDIDCVVKTAVEYNSSLVEVL